MRQNRQHVTFRDTLLLHHDLVNVDAFHIAILLDRRKARVGHSNLFTLVDIRCALH
ncbi:Uncharacterised protein [Vibrio cholerae]|nr:Uncharacterised protein [Vibrio cholerae]CSI52436.1 Uncharacterised protein [Vibrio cholerae]